ncbi:MAG: hypothetical protein J6Y02_21760 [Pseudobutyrivibrio sp.]|nr:hypothetical protein [Pseudobutyrivibrio sp.]
MSVYKAVITTNNELMHFNKNHSRHNGQFISGDGDGDGVTDDHHRNKEKIPEESGALGVNRRKEAKKNGGWHPITNPYEHSSAAGKTPDRAKKLSKSSIFKSGSFAEFLDENGKVDNKAYTKSGVKKLLGGVSAIAVGRFLQNSDNLIANGVGYTAELLGAFGAGAGAAQTFIGVANQVHNARERKSK